MFQKGSLMLFTTALAYIVESMTYMYVGRSDNGTFGVLNFRKNLAQDSTRKEAKIFVFFLDFFGNLIDSTPDNKFKKRISYTYLCR
jgi:S-adenosylmethionine hydrolase